MNFILFSNKVQHKKILRFQLTDIVVFCFLKEIKENILESDLVRNWKIYFNNPALDGSFTTKIQKSMGVL